MKNRVKSRPQKFDFARAIILAINIYYNLFRFNRRSKIFQTFNRFFKTKPRFFCIETTFFVFITVIIPVQNRMKIIQWNYSRLATIAWAKQECNDYYSIFHLFVHVGLGVLLNDPFGESIASISLSLSRSLSSLSFNLSLPNQKKFLNESIGVLELQGWWIDFRFRNRSTKHRVAIWNALISSVQVFVSMNVPQILTPWQRLCNKCWIRYRRKIHWREKLKKLILCRLINFWITFFFFKYLELNVNDISFLNKCDIVVII